MNKLDISRATQGLTDEEIRRCVTMATYEHFDSVLNAALGDEYVGMGFRLTKVDWNTVELYFKDKRLATYFADKATIDNVREGCKNYIASLIRSI